AYPTRPKTRFLIEAVQIENPDHPIETSGNIKVTVKESVDSIGPGDRIRLTGWLYRPRAPQNPGAYDWAARLRDEGIFAGLSCDHAASVILLEKSATRGWQGLRDRLRNRLNGYLIDRAFAEDDESAGVLAAMVLGQRGAVDRATNEAFIRTGNAHFLAASGLHVGWLAFIGWAVLKLFRVPYRAVAVVLAVLIVTYVLIAEPRPSILRAGIIGLIGCAGVTIRRRLMIVNWLSASAVVILLIDPADLFRPAFQLSFVAVLAVMHLSGVIRERMDHYLPFLPRWKLAILHPPRRFPYAEKDKAGGPSLPRLILYGLMRAVRLSICVSIAAWLANIPLAAWHFDRFASWGWLGTLLLWIPAFVVTALGYLKLLCGLVFPPSAQLFGPLLAGATEIMLDWVRLLARVPGTLVDGRSPSLAWVCAVYGCLYLRVYRRNLIPTLGTKQIRIPHCYKLLVLVLVLWWAVPPRWVKADRGAMNVWMLAVGNGTGTVIELPDGRTLLYDFGTRSPYDVSRVGVHFLKHRGIREIEAAFVSHPNFDHYGGLEALAKEIPIRRLVISDQFEQFVEVGSQAARFLQGMRSLGVEVEVIGGPTVLKGMGSVTIETIWPPPATDRLAPDANNSSIVLRLDYQNRSILLTGDISEWGIGGLLAEGEIRADALALPHHGSVVHNTATFIEAVNPSIVVRSTGQRRALTINGIEMLVGDRTYFNTADVGCARIRIADGEIRAWAAME
ncbi:MAG: ComEC/Rec2 family competence protein, partial [Phycisphaerae bacterium]